MVRVIGGTAGGLLLRVPKGERTRPTADRIKESLFNILRAVPAGARVLDLFAGSGALGIEALSRGAEEATFVEVDPEALRAIRENLAHTGFAGRARVVRARLPRAEALAAGGPYDLVFMDPPYDRGLVAPTLAWLAGSGLLAPGARLVVEHSAKEEIPSGLKNVRLLRQERFGETRISFLEYEGCEAR